MPDPMMTVGELMDALAGFPRDMPVEVATSPRPDEWYQIDSVENLPNHRGTVVCVINTD